MKNHLEKLVNDGVVVKDNEGLYVPNYEQGYEVYVNGFIMAYLEYNADTNKTFGHYYVCDDDVLDIDNQEIHWLDVSNPADISYTKLLNGE